MEKRGTSTVAVIIIAILIIAVLVLGFGIGSTGKATETKETKGANYGPIEADFRLYPECQYVGVNDGWDVTRKSEVTYKSITSGTPERSVDVCMGSESVKEYHCVKMNDGTFAQSRNVGCPFGQICSDGVCHK